MKRINIFLASSSELEDERREFELFIRRENSILFERSIRLELIIWEDFFDAMAKTRLQDEYNKAIKSCEVFIMLFSTKVGKYTLEEFETAFGEFKANNKPLIFTYFKNVSHKIGSINRDDIKSLWAFQDKLTELGHYQTPYEHTDSLLKHFNTQLSKYVLPKEPIKKEKFINFYDISEDREYQGWTTYNTNQAENEIDFIENGFKLTAKGTDIIGVNKAFNFLKGSVEFESKVSSSNLSRDNLIIYMIPMQENGPDRSGYIEVGSTYQDEPENEFSPFRQRQLLSAKEVNKWKLYSIEFDFSETPNAFYSIFAPRINEGCPRPDKGEFQIRNIKVKKALNNA